MKNKYDIDTYILLTNFFKTNNMENENKQSFIRN